MPPLPATPIPPLPAPATPRPPKRVAPPRTIFLGLHSTPAAAKHPNRSPPTHRLQIPAILVPRRPPPPKSPARPQIDSAARPAKLSHAAARRQDPRPRHASPNTQCTSNSTHTAIQKISMARNPATSTPRSATTPATPPRPQTPPRPPSPSAVPRKSSAAQSESPPSTPRESRPATLLQHVPPPEGIPLPTKKQLRLRAPQVSPASSDAACRKNAARATLRDLVRSTRPTTGRKRKSPTPPETTPPHPRPPTSRQLLQQKPPPTPPPPSAHPNSKCSTTTTTAPPAPPARLQSAAQRSVE